MRPATARRSGVALAVVAASLALTPAHGADKPSKPSFTLRVPNLQGAPGPSTWPSGMAMVLHPDETVSGVVTTVVIQAGRGAEGPGESGAASLFEALWWASSTDDGVGVVDAFVHGLGCEVDSHVGHEAITLQSVCARETQDAAMRLWSRLFTDPLHGLGLADVTAAWARIRRDGPLRTRLSTEPLRRMVTPLQAQLYPAEHPYGGPVDADLDGLTLDAIATFAARHVKPSEATVAIVGDYDDRSSAYGTSLFASNLAPSLLHPELTEEHLRRFPKDDDTDPDTLPADPYQVWAYAVDPASGADALQFIDDRTPRSARTPEPPPAPVGEPFVRQTGPVDRPWVVVGWSLPASYGEDDALQRATAWVLRQVVAKQLAELRDPALERFAGCAVIPGTVHATLACAMEIVPGEERSGERLARRVPDQVSFLLDPGARVTVEIALGKAQTALYASQLRVFDTVDGLWGSRSGWMAHGLHFDGDTMAASNAIQGVAGVTVDDVIGLAGEWLGRDRSRAVQLDPPDTEALAVRHLPDELRDVDTIRDHGPYLTRLAGQAAPRVPGAEPTPEAIAAAYEPLPEDRVVKSRLPNGMWVLAAQVPEVPEAHLRLVARTGPDWDVSGHHGATFARLFTRFHRESPAEFGGAYYAWPGTDRLVLGWEGSSDNLDAVLWLARDALDGRTASFRGKGERLGEVEEAVLADLYDPDARAAEARRAHVLGPAGRPITLQDLAAWDDLGLDAVRDGMLATWQPDNVVAVVVGPQRPSDLVSQVGRYLGGYSSPAPETDTYRPRAVEAGDASGTVLAQVYGTDDPVAELGMSCRIGGSPEAQEAAAHLVAGGLDGLPSATVDVVQRPDGAATVEVIARGRPEELGTGAAAVRAHLESLAAGVSDADARTAAYLAAAATQRSGLSAERTLARLSDLFLAEVEPDDDAARGTAYGAVDGATLTAALAGCRAGMAVTAVGDASALTTALSGAGLSPETVDWQAEARAAHEAADPKGFKKYMKRRDRGR